MDYEKEYKAALERARDVYTYYCEDSQQVRKIESIFPELKESENEKIRKALISILKSDFEKDTTIYDISVCDIIAWLEKQGEQASPIKWHDVFFIPQEQQELLVEWDSEDETWHDIVFYHADTKTFWDCEKQIEGVTKWCYIKDLLGKQESVKENDERLRKTTISFLEDFAKQGYENAIECIDWLEKLAPKPQGKSVLETIDDINDKGYCCVVTKQGKSALEAIKEERVDNANKVETKDYSSIDPHFFKTPNIKSKFKVGDWVVKGKTIAQILDIQEQYYVGIDINGNDFTSSRFLPDDKIHLWTIKDAKDGDVLASNNSIFIFQREYIAGKPVAYCGIMNGCFVKGTYDCWTNEQCYPADKEQRDALIKAMAEVGYAWDNKNKILNVEPKFHKGDWITNGQYNKLIIGINSDYPFYIFEDGTTKRIKDIDEKYHLWDITKDAKPGDVLACKSGWTCIFKTLVNDETFSSYCFMDNTKWFWARGSECHTLNKAFLKVYNGKIYPATKEQRDLLFQKMKEAGYEWDADNKYLINI